jgi:hypothetical protein
MLSGLILPKAHEIVTEYLQKQEIIDELRSRIPPSSARDITISTTTGTSIQRNQRGEIKRVMAEWHSYFRKSLPTNRKPMLS